MNNYITYPMSVLKIRKVLVILSLGICLYCHNSWAAQEAIVTTEKAIIYSSPDMKAPIGYVVRGKKIKVGEVLKGRSGLYPIVVSNRIAYIRAKDIGFNVEENQIMATRFYELTKEKFNKRISFGFTNYATSMDTESGDGEKYNWMGYQLKGEAFNDNRWGIQVLTSGLWATNGDEQFRMIELGLGGAYTILQLGPVRANLFAQLMGVPFANYSQGTKLRINGAGFGLGAGVAASVDLAKRWGAEGTLGIYRTKLGGFSATEDYETPDPTFNGSRLTLSAYYRFD